MSKTPIIKFLVISTLIGIIAADVNGLSAGDQDEADQNRATLQHLKEYIQPIIYQKFLRIPGDSEVAQHAKTVVSEYLADSLVDTVKIPAEEGQVHVPQRPSLKQGTNGTNNANTVTSQLQNLLPGRNRTRPSQQHVFNQVDQIIQNVNGGNISGIVDQALLIRAPAPVRQLVNGILSAALCNPFNRLWNRCSGGGSIIFGNAPASGPTK